MRERKARIKKLRLNYFVLYTCSSLLLAFFVVAALTSAKYTELTELGFKGFLSFLGMVAFGILSASSNRHNTALNIKKDGVVRNLTGTFEGSSS